MQPLTDRLRDIVQADEWLMEVLRVVCAIALPGWAVAGGAVRDRVWDVLHGRVPALPKDVDVPYFDPNDLERTRERSAEVQLRGERPDVDWDVKNQAAVHLWYRTRFGVDIAPARDTTHAVSRWVETATCVGVRLEGSGELGVLAPLGLEDLFSLRLRANPLNPNPHAFDEHLREKRFVERWPRLRITKDEQD